MNAVSYKDSNYDEALAAGCDVVQLKYDGWWSHIILNGPSIKYFSKTHREFRSDLTTNTRQCEIIAETLTGTQWAQTASRKDTAIAFDLASINSIALDSTTYRDRHALLRTLQPELPHNFSLVQNYPIAAFHELWETYVINMDYEGVVFRSTKWDLNHKLYRQKLIVTEDLTLISIYEGEGKHSGRLGGINGRTPEGIMVKVGGGFSDALREDIWNEPGKYLGRTFEIEARRKFASGSFRHPNFVKWKL